MQFKLCPDGLEDAIYAKHQAEMLKRNNPAVDRDDMTSDANPLVPYDGDDPAILTARKMNAEAIARGTFEDAEDNKDYTDPAVNPLVP